MSADERGPRYLGTVPVEVAGEVGGRQLVVLALDAWSGWTEIRGCAAPSSDPRQRVLLVDRVATDAGTVHRYTNGSSAGGVDARLDWVARIEPALPADARAIDVSFRLPMAASPGAPPIAAELRSAVPTWPPTRGPEVALVPAVVPPTEQVTPDLADDRVAHPLAVRPVSSLLVAGSASLVVASLDAWPRSFTLHVALVPWSDEGLARLGSARWSAVDDAGHTYAGALRSGGSAGEVASVDVSFVPALDAAARSLTLVVPDPTGAGALQAEVPLPQL